MKPSVPAWISRAAMLLGIVLFGVTLAFIDREATLRESRRLGVLLPLVLLPGAGWHVVRTLGWLICFPPDVRPSFWRLFRVRLAADAVSYFTIRGVASEPLRVVLLLDRVPAEVSAASTILERTGMGVMSVVLVGATSAVAMRSDAVPEGWQNLFRWIAIVAVVVVGLTAIFLTRQGRYLGPLFEGLYRRTGWHWTEGRVARFIRDVEAIFLDLARSDRRRLRDLSLLAIAAYALMTLEIWVVFWAIHEPVTVWSAMFVETFTRSASIFSGMIPANLGALEASNVVVVRALGLAGAGSLALSRRVRGLIWAGLGLVLYPRDTLRTHHREDRR
ncbi:MAG TPA: lysylphosphatidylglycerol synthase domain-containing protein [Vicinamibacterales bacterium]|nr:lysylphosphatidylglycerol synthase domain-containing protein [Vicinamibacterales bacterium]